MLHYYDAKGTKCSGSAALVLLSSTSTDCGTSQGFMALLCMLLFFFFFYGVTPSQKKLKSGTLAVNRIERIQEVTVLKW